MAVVVCQPSTSSGMSSAPLLFGFSGRQRRHAGQDQPRPAGWEVLPARGGEILRQGRHLRPVQNGCRWLALPDRAQTRRDFEQMLELGANCVRIYHTPAEMVHGSGPGTGAEDFPGRRVAEESDLRWRRGVDARRRRRRCDRPHGRAGIIRPSSPSASSTRFPPTSCATSAGAGSRNSSTNS